MTEKITITQEQADAVDLLLKSVTGMRVVNLVRAIKEGYEVEPEYKIGDWVVRINGNPFITMEIAIQVSEIKDGFIIINGDILCPFRLLRNATPDGIKAEEERQKWAGIEEGDVLRQLPYARQIGMFVGNADDETVLVQNFEGQHIWKKSECELYAKKVGATK